jgi:hypothetical protein
MAKKIVIGKLTPDERVAYAGRLLKGRKGDIWERQAKLQRALDRGDLLDESLAPAFATALGTSRLGDWLVQNVVPKLPRAFSAPLRGSFQPGNEQGNAARLAALMALEKEDSFDVVREVLTDSDEGGKYGNLRNTAFELMAKHFPGNAGLEDAMWKAFEIDEYLSAYFATDLLATYASDRALDKLVSYLPEAPQRAAAGLLSSPHPKAKERLQLFLEDAVENGSPDLLQTLLGVEELFERPHLERLATRVEDEDPERVSVGMQAAIELGPDVAMEALKKIFAGHGKKNAARAAAALAEVKPPEGDRTWIDLLGGYLSEATDKNLREQLVIALGRCGLDALDVMLAAPRDDKDKGALDGLREGLEMMDVEPEALRPRLEAELENASPKKLKVLKEALKYLSDEDGEDD